MSFISEDWFAEIIEVSFDPSRISYREILNYFWSHHDASQQRKKQYKSAILYTDEEQKKIAEETLEEEKVIGWLMILLEDDWLFQKRKPRPLETYVQQLDTFYEAEAYHQKYWLRSQDSICRAVSIGITRITSSFLRS